MKKVLSILLIAILLISCLPLTGCGSQGFTLVEIGKLNEHVDGKIQSHARAIKKQDECNKEDYICILDKNYKDGTQIPSEKDGHPVVYLSALDSFDESEATKIDIPDSIKIIDHVSPDGNDKLKSVSMPEGVTVVNSFCYCSELEDVDFDKPAEIEDSFTGCPKLKSEVFEESKNAKNCTVILQIKKDYDYKNMKFDYRDIRDAEDTSKLTKPKGKWVQVDMKFKAEGDGIKNDDLNKLINEENMLLNGAKAEKWQMTVPKDTKISYSLKDGSITPTECELTVYYDVPNDFVICSGEIECFNEVKMSEKK